ncbi:MmgE/PrpD family protein [Streptomyces sp. MUM 2J]|uniref:MmgE/PrpD family protein n=1 Tax=Streptomyces sp. MUM 2J TaxID=2791987 RepID=UPI001F04A133|nr:MmgE/PrpD family protein [Streptomyces sp. MUM 2J]MCH0564812.1 MmgE/PrpD family protein [Streptomyces sp. MUM 2J]
MSLKSASSADGPTPGSRGGPTDPDGPTGKLANWLAATTLDDVPDPVRDRAKHLLLDGVACALVGAKLPASRIAVEALAALDGAGDSVITGWGGLTTGPLTAAMLNSGFIQGFELDDYHPFGPLHSNAVVLPALLAAAGHRPETTGARFLLAAVLGYEVGPRVGMALHGADIMIRGWHSGTVFGPPAAAAAAGTLYHLDAVGFEDALGMACTQAGGLMAVQFESMVKRMHHGFAARNGLVAAVLAASGYTGIKRVFEREYGGFLTVFGQGQLPDPSRIAGTLDEIWETERIAVKPYAACGGLHAAMDAALQLRGELQLSPEDIEKIAGIRIDLARGMYEKCGWTPSRPLEPIGAQMNAAYAVAVALVDGAGLFDQFTRERAGREDVWRLIGRTETRHDPVYDEGGLEQQLTTRLRLTLGDGTVHETVVVQPRGVGENRLSNAEIVEKYRALTRRAIDPARSQALEEAVLGLDTLPDIGVLTALLQPPVRSPGA